jgi:hypothetical protein
MIHPDKRNIDGDSTTKRNMEQIYSVAPLQQVMGEVVKTPPPAIWPSGIAITDRPGTDDNCGWPLLCGFNFFYTDDQRAISAAVTPMSCCSCDNSLFETPAETQVFGMQVSFRATQAMCDRATLIRVTADGTRDVGRVVMYAPCCPCEAYSAEAFDVSGQSRFKHKEHACLPNNGAAFCGDSCGWQHNTYAVYASDGLPADGPVALIERRLHCCAQCFPQWHGLRQTPYGASADEQLLLLGMVHACWYKTLLEQ